MHKIAIIGAGITGLTIGSNLSEYADITILEKSRGKGGRMSTRRVGDYHFDHGAQYFVAKTQSFEEFLKKPLDAGVIQQWNAKFVEFTGVNISRERSWDDNFKHYVGVPTMSSLAHFMAKGLLVQNNVKVSKVALNPLYDSTISNNERKWALTSDSDGDLGSYDWVITTCPVDQAKHLLPSDFIYYNRLNQTKMQACFALMLGFKEELPLDFDVALVRESAISWIAVNSRKPQRPDNFSLLIQSNNDWADKNKNADINWVKEHLIQETERIIGHSLENSDYSNVHRWLYANTMKQKDNKGSVFLDSKNKLAAAGDWCGNARVESAFVHGMKLVSELKPLLLK